LALTAFWEVSAYIANSLVFLLMGIALQGADLIPMAGRFSLTFAGMMLVRFVIIWAAAQGLVAAGRPFPPAWRTLVAWSGLRGSIPIALVLGINPSNWVGGPHPDRQELLTLVSGVVLLSLVVQGLSIGPLLRRLGILTRDAGEEAFESETANRIAASAAYRRLEELQVTGEVPPAIQSVLVAEIQERDARSREAQEALLKEHPQLAHSRTDEIRRTLLLAERSALELAMHQGQIGTGIAEKAGHRIDGKLIELGERH